MGGSPAGGRREVVAFETSCGNSILGSGRGPNFVEGRQDWREGELRRRLPKIRVEASSSCSVRGNLYK